MEEELDKSIQKLNEVSKIQISSINNRSLSKIKYNIIKSRKIKNTSSENISFWSVLENRRSKRGTKDFDGNSLEQLLYRAARVQNTKLAEDDFLRTERPYPAAGGRHSIDILCIINNVKGIEKGVWYFNPYNITLNQVKIDNKFMEEINLTAINLSNIQEAPPATLVFISDIEKIISRYKNGINFIFKDVGNLSAVLSLASEAIGLDSCQLGISKAFEYYKDLEVRDNRLWICGALILSGRLK